jgi:hypothetical protein
MNDELKRRALGAVSARHARAKAAATEAHRSAMQRFIANPTDDNMAAIIAAQDEKLATDRALAEALQAL